MATLVIGATGGIGGALARGWPEEALWLSGRDGAKLDTLATELKATPLKADLGYESHIRALFGGLSLPLSMHHYYHCCRCQALRQVAACSRLK